MQACSLECPAPAIDGGNSRSACTGECPPDQQAAARRHSPRSTLRPNSLSSNEDLSVSDAPDVPVSDSGCGTFGGLSPCPESCQSSSADVPAQPDRHDPHPSQPLDAPLGGLDRRQMICGNEEWPSWKTAAATAPLSQALPSGAMRDARTRLDSYRRETLSDYQQAYRRPEGATRTLSQVALAQRDAWNSRRSDDTVAKRWETLGGYEHSPYWHLGSSLRASQSWHGAGLSGAPSPREAHCSIEAERAERMSELALAQRDAWNNRDSIPIEQLCSLGAQSQQFWLEDLAALNHLAHARTWDKKSRR